MAQSTKVPNPGAPFTGQVWRQAFGDDAIDLIFHRLSAAAVRNGLHIHTEDQLLVVAEGRGVVATAVDRRDVSVGDLAFIPKGEPYWCGAAEGSAFAHLVVSRVGNRTAQVRTLRAV